MREEQAPPLPSIVETTDLLYWVKFIFVFLSFLCVGFIEIYVCVIVDKISAAG